MIFRILMSLLLLTGSIVLALAQEDVDDPGGHNSLLNGAYQVTNHISCVDSQGGFDAPPTLQARGFGGTAIDTDSGTILFDGYGNATDVRRGISIFPGPVLPGSFPSGTYEVTCRYTYSVSIDRSFTLNGNCTGMLPAGPLAGWTFVIPQVGVSGQIGKSGHEFIVSGVEPVQQLLTLSGPGGETIRTERLCGASGIGIRLRR